MPLPQNTQQVIRNPASTLPFYNITVSGNTS